jgi:hypothetical protein
VGSCGGTGRSEAEAKRAWWSGGCAARGRSHSAARWLGEAESEAMDAGRGAKTLTHGGRPALAGLGPALAGVPALADLRSGFSRFRLC